MITSDAEQNLVNLLREVETDILGTRKYSRIEEVVQLADEVASGDQLKVLGFLLPIWNSTDALVIARRLTIAAAEDLAWVQLDSASMVANLLRRSYVNFPEIERSARQSELADRVFNKLQPQEPLKGALLAFCINPSDSKVSEQLAVEMARSGRIEQLAEFVRHLNVKNGNLLTLKILQAVERLPSSTLVPVLGSLAESLAPGDSLAALRLGRVIEQQMAADTPPREVPGALAVAVGGNRHRLAANRRKSAVKRRQLTSDLMPTLESLSNKLSDQIGISGDALYASEGMLRSESEGRDRSGVCSWYDYANQPEVRVIEASGFRTEYGSRNDDGCITAQQHQGRALQYGPYISLQAGVYDVEFLGHAEPGITLEFAVTANYGTEVLSRMLELIRPTRLTRLVVSKVHIRELKANCEFVVRSHSKDGLVSVTGVRLMRLPQRYPGANLEDVAANYSNQTA